MKNIFRKNAKKEATVEVKVEDMIFMKEALRSANLGIKCSEDDETDGAVETRNSMRELIRAVYGLMDEMLEAEGYESNGF